MPLPPNRVAIVFGNQVRAQRKNLSQGSRSPWEQVSQRQLGARAGTSQSKINAIEQGTANLTLQAMCSVAAACNCELQIVLVPRLIHSWNHVHC